jgi:hypothetical protein
LAEFDFTHLAEDIYLFADLLIHLALTIVEDNGNIIPFQFVTIVKVNCFLPM